jgi:hypothetical protein
VNRVHTPYPLHRSEREKGREIKCEKGGGERDKDSESEKEREGERELEYVFQLSTILIFIFKRNDGCHGTF